MMECVRSRHSIWRIPVSAFTGENRALNYVGDLYSRREYDIITQRGHYIMRMQISAPAAESLALNSVGDSYSRREYDITKGG